MSDIFKSAKEKELDACIGSLTAAPTLISRRDSASARYILEIAANEIKKAEHAVAQGQTVAEVLEAIHQNKELYKNTNFGVGFLLAELYLRVAKYRAIPKIGQKAKIACQDFRHFMHLKLSQSAGESNAFDERQLREAFQELSGFLTARLAIPIVVGDLRFLVEEFNRVFERSEELLSANTSVSMLGLVLQITDRASKVDTDPMKVDLRLADWVEVMVFCEKMMGLCDEAAQSAEKTSKMESVRNLVASELKDLRVRKRIG